MMLGRMPSILLVLSGGSDGIELHTGRYSGGQRPHTGVIGVAIERGLQEDNQRAIDSSKDAPPLTEGLPGHDAKHDQ